MLFSDIPIRRNTNYIPEEWFNTLRQAGIDSQGQLGTVNSVDSTNDDDVMSGGYYLADSTASTFSLRLPPVSQNLIVTVKKVSALNEVLIARNQGTELIDGVAGNYTVKYKNESVTFITDGIDWFIV
jgi:hypothetical protein